MEGKERKKPEHEIRRGAVIATIWRSDRAASDRYHVAFKRLFRGEGGWKDSRNFLERDLPTIAELAGETARWIEERKRSVAAEPSKEP